MDGRTDIACGFLYGGEELWCPKSIARIAQGCKLQGTASPATTCFYNGLSARSRLTLGRVGKRVGRASTSRSTGLCLNSPAIRWAKREA